MTASLLQHRKPSVGVLNLAPLQVDCVVRTRIPSEFGGTCSLYLYANNHDNEEHMAIVYGEDIKSASLEALKPGDTDYDRMVRGAAKVTVVNDNNCQNKKKEERNDHNNINDASIVSHDIAKVPDEDVDSSDDEMMTSSITNNGIPIQPPILSLRPPKGQFKRKDRSYVDDNQPPLVRVHSCCFTGEVLGSLRCDCAEQLQEAMKQMSREQRGVVLYLVQEGRGIGLKEKLKAYNLIDQGHDTLTANVLLGHPPDARTYHIATAILKDLNIISLRLLTNNPDKLLSLERDGITMTERIPMVPASWKRYSTLGTTGIVFAASDIQDRDGYLMTKVERMGHILDVPQQVSSAVRAKRKAIDISIWTGG